MELFSQTALSNSREITPDRNYLTYMIQNLGICEEILSKRHTHQLSQLLTCFAFKANFPQ